MPLWLAPVLILPGIALYRKSPYILVVALGVVLMGMVVDEGWMEQPGPKDQVSVMAMQVLLPGILIASWLERGWLDRSRVGLALLATSFFLGVLVYYLLFPYILATGVLPGILITSLLFTGLPLGCGLIWRRVGGGAT